MSYIQSWISITVDEMYVKNTSKSITNAKKISDNVLGCH